MGDIDTSSGGSVAERLARLKASKQQAPALPPKPPSLPPKAPALPQRTNTSTSINGRQPLPPPPLVKPKPPPLPSRSKTVQPAPTNGARGEEAMVRRIPPVFTTKSAIDLGTQPAQPECGGGNIHLQMESLQLGATKRSVPPVPPLPSRTSSGTRAIPPLPQLPARKTPSVHNAVQKGHSHQSNTRSVEQEVPSPRPARRLPPPANEAPPPAPPPAPKPQQSTDIPKNAKIERPPPVPANRPPAVNLSSRPIAPSADVFNAEMAACLKCRDFKRVDLHAARPEFDRMRATSISGLALALTEPFTDTIDKARVIFTWLHHNVAYDVVSFFARNIGPQTPENTLRNGLAVCDGYAQLYRALALAAGLKCERVGGYGAGYGHSDKNPPSKYEGNHAWNAVLFPEPHGWHLLDACWGAGHLGQDQQYKKEFNPSQFTMSPKEFGKQHFPEEPRWQCILNPISWHEFSHPPPGPKIWGCGKKGDWKAHSVSPWMPNLPSGRVRIELQKSCPHLKEKRGGKPDYLIVAFRKNKHPLPFREVDQFGTIAIELDVEKGEEVSIGPLNTINGRDAKGLTADEWIPQMGRCGWSSGGYLVTWGRND